MLRAALRRAEPLDEHAPLAHAGLSSLMAARLWVELDDALGVEIPLTWLAGELSVAELALRISGSLGEGSGGAPRGSPPDRAGRGAPRVTPDRDARGEPYPLTALQQAYLAGSHPALTRDPVGCQQYLELEIADLDPQRLESAWRRLVSHHDALRTVLTADGMQRLTPAPPGWTMPVHDLTALGRRECEAATRAVRDRLTAVVLEPGRWPRFAVEASLRAGLPALVHVGLDGAMCDGHGAELLLSQWAACYEDPDHELPTAGLGARECVLAMALDRDDPAHRRDLEHWRERLAGAPDGPSLGRALARTGGSARSVLSGRLPASGWAALRDRAAAQSLSPSSLVLAVFAGALRRAGATAPFSLVVTTSARAWLPAEVDAVVGPFTTTAVVVADEATDGPATAGAAALHRQVWSALAHPTVCCVDVARDLRARGDPAPGELHVVFTGLHDAGESGAGAGFADHVSYATNRTSDVALEHQIAERDGELHYRWDVATEHADEATVRSAFAHFVTGLNAACAPTGELDVSPANALQQAYLVARSGTPAEGCQIYESFEVPALDMTRLERALLELVADHDAMRAWLDRDGSVRTLAAPPPAWRIPVIDLEGERDVAAALETVREELVDRPFPLGRWPAFDVRVTRCPGAAVVHCSFDVAVFDAPSVHRLCRELLRSYDGAPSARRQPAAARPAEPEGRDAARAHWEARAGGLPAGPRLPRREEVVPAGLAPRARVHARLRGWRDLVAKATRAGISPDALLLAAFTEVLAEEAADPEFAVAVVRWSDAAPRPGEHTQMSWLRAAPPGGALEDAALRYAGELEADRAADGVSGLEVMRRHALRRSASGAYAHPVVYSSVVELTDLPLPAGVRPGPWMSCTPGVTLDCIATAQDDELDLCWDGVAAAFPDGWLAGTFHRYVRLVASLAAPRGAVRPPRLTSAERTAVFAWNETQRDLQPSRPAHAAFEDRVRERPHAVAVRCAGADTSYARLDALANRIALRLRAAGAGPGSVVAIATPRSPELVAAVLGVLKAGAAYLPVEPGLPGDRAETMMTRAKARIVLTLPGTARWPEPSGATVVQIDGDLCHAEVADAADPPHVASAQDTAYIVFTSGSTGTPKGVAVSHGAVANLLAWCSRTFGQDAGDVALGVTSLGFDLSVFDILGVLGSGATLYLADDHERRDPAALLDIVLGHGVTIWNSAPTTLAQLAPLLREATGEPAARALRLVLLSGDFPPLWLPDAIRAAFPRTRVVNLGGATEATVWSNAHEVGEVDPAWRSLPYGRPIDNARYYVLDASLAACRPGTAGELYIAGRCLSDGYVGEPSLTAMRFLPDPYSVQPGERMYRTGDRASHLPDGTITLLGRDDGQVKIRGFRVELGEIEHCLRRHPAVSDAIVLARPAGQLDRRLAAYVVAESPEPTSAEVRAHASRSLPEHMVPNAVCVLRAFPTTANGKVDRAALPWPIAPAGVAETDATAASPDARREAVLRDEIAALLAKLLELETVDATQDIWDLGATSFTLVQVSNVLKERYGRWIPVAAVLADPTVAGIARHVAGGATPELARAGVVEPPEVDPFSASDRARFMAARLNRRPQNSRGRILELAGDAPSGDRLCARASRREFAGEAIPASALGRLLGTLVPRAAEGRARYLYPSAGDTYAVQVYLHVKPGRVDRIPGGVYYHRPESHSLERVGDGASIDRSAYFVSDRALYDAAAFEVFLIGQAHAIEPLYRESADRYLAIEAGHISQLLMLAQHEHGLGLCPIGELAFERLRPELDLDDGHRFLLGFVGGGVAPGTSRARQSKHVPARGREIAIVGLAGRYPGADDIDALWQNLRSGVCAIGPPPSHRGPLASAALEGGFLDRVDEFDSLLFQIAPVEARALDPQLRLVLEAVWACLEHAGHTAASLTRGGRRVGVFVATMWHDYELLGAEAGAAATGACATASDIPNRVSHAFDLTGPSVAVDTSCSSSLAALHLAVRSLYSGECDAAVVAGCNVLAHPYHADLLAGWGLTPGPGDETGWLPGEGVGALLLRPATSAAIDADTIHALVEGTWCAHAGRPGRFGVPDQRTLADSICAAIESAGLTPDQIGYVECAASGAAVADAVEMEALEAVFGGEPRADKLAVGTLKHNIGHLEAASGLSQLTKVVLQLDRAEIAPVPDQRPDALRDVAGSSAVRIVDRVEPWDGPRPRRALVNAVGAAGSYAHAVLRGPPSAPAPPDPPGPHAVVLSAATAHQLRELARRLDAHVVRAAADEPTLAQVAHTLQTGRVQLEHRLGIWCEDRLELAAALDAFLQGVAHPRLRTAVAGAERERFAAADERSGLDAWLLGRDVEWDAAWPAAPRRVALPGYPFARESHWIDAGSREAGAVVEHLRELYSEISGIPVSRLDPHVALERYGLTSALVVRLNAALERDFGVVSTTLAFEHRTLAELAGALAAGSARGAAAVASARPIAPPALPSEQPADVAIVGIAGRYPGARNLDELWQLLEAGRDCIAPMPASRRRPGWPAELMVGSFLDDVDRFDALLFGIAPRDADLMDPQERLFLETVWELLDDAGYPRARLSARHGGRVGVFAATMYNDYTFLGVERSLRGTPVSTGSSTAGIANRVSHVLDLRGPSMTVDTMCSASLTAVHLALSSLRLGECELAIAGGVNLSLHPNKFIEQARLRMTSSDHRCRAFGAGGDGFAPGEGVGAVLLKPLRAAVEAGDRIHAIVRASALNHDGHTNGYTVPSPVAQGELVARALREARIDPLTVGYVEAHGTGTALGDPIEIAGLARAFAGHGIEPGGCAIGSVKSNIGHLEGAAGIAGLTKVVLQLRHRTLAPTLHAEQPNPRIDWPAVPFRIQSQLADWPAPAGGGPRRACVSSFGAGGANAHVVVEEPAPDSRPAQVASSSALAFDAPQLIVLSARDGDRLTAMAERLADAIDGGADGRLDEIAYTLQVGREPLPERLAIVASDRGELSRLLRAHVRGEEGGIRGRVASGSSRGPSYRPARLDRAELAGAGERWTRGEEVRWELLHPGGAPRMVGLPSYPFAGRRHWLAEQDDRDEPLALLVKSWRAATGEPAPAAAADAPPAVCLFDIAAQDVAGRLAEACPRVTPVRVDEGDPLRAVRALLAGEPDIAGCIDLCDLGRAQPRTRLDEVRVDVLDSLLARGRPQRVLVAVAGLHHVPDAPGGARASLGGALMASFVGALAAERRLLDASVVDVDATGDVAAQLLEEWRARDSPAVVCRRGGRRYAPTLEPLEIEPATPALDPDLAYVVTGATGGIGGAVAAHLVRRGARRLALLGHRPVRASSIDGDARDPTPHEAQVAELVRALRGAGARVALHTGPLTDRARLGGFLDEVRATAGGIGGVVHCAGAMAAAGAFASKDRFAVDAVLEPKVAGLTTLLELCEVDRPAFAVLFSSLAGIAPRLGVGVVEYAAANAFVDLTAAHHARGGWCVGSIAWPPWATLGMDAEIGVDVGVRALRTEEALEILDAVIARRGPANVVVAPPAGASLDVERLLAVPARATGAMAPEARRAAGAAPAWLVDCFCAAVGVTEDELDPALAFSELGVDSILIADLVERIEAHLGVPVDPGVLIAHPTLERLGRHLADLPVRGDRAPSRPESGPPRTAPGRGGDDRESGRIAVVGLGCRLPGACDVRALWENLRQGRCAICDVPPSRWDVAALYDSVPAPGRSISRWGGFVEGIEDFDPEYFGMSADEATCLDPGIRLVLEGAAATIADAGYEDHELDGRDVGVFVGARMSNYGARLGVRPGRAGFGADQNFIAARVAQHYNLGGPNMVVDSACSSALVAVQLAVRSLQAGESELALAGGVEILLDERPYLDFSAARALSPSGRCRTFDERADGFVPGEGCGLLLLKPLDRARADGDRIHAVVDAVAVGNDGRTIGLTTPSPEAQAAVVRRALSAGRRRADELGMIEAHGTATPIGDPIELQALAAVFGESTDRRGFCAIGSVKSNVGHLLGAAGIAGLLKAILAIDRGEIPPTLFCEKPNPRFEFATSPFFPNRELLRWNEERERRVAGVSAFGLGGTNAHVVLSGAPEDAASGARRAPLPAPSFHRRRLWLEPGGATTGSPPADLVASLLDLSFDDDPADARGLG